MSINIKPGKLLLTGDLDQSPVKVNMSNKKICYTFYWVIFLYHVLNVNLYVFCGNIFKHSSNQHHQKLCASISQLQEQQRDNINNSPTYYTTLTINEARAVAELVGER